ncbi:MAG: hypothetical protein K9K75_04765 [Deltaproteobacteria bacterium]|nr:hypothetical protein [Deltaproteobacteria bacterium]
MSRRYLLVVILAIILAGSLASSRQYISIDAPEFRKIKVAVPEFATSKATGANGLWFSQEIANKLLLTGFVSIVDRTSDNSAITASAVELAADFLVCGTISPQGEISIVLLDTVNSAKLATKSYPDSQQRPLATSRKIAADIFSWLTGEQGPFDSRIVFVAAKKNHWEVRSVHFDGTDEQLLHTERHIIVAPFLSPNQRYLAFTSYAEGKPAVFIKDLVMGTVRKIAAHQGINVAGDWSRNSEEILFSASDGKGGEQIYRIGKDGRGKKKITDTDGTNISPSWSPDNSKIIFTANEYGTPQIFVMEADGTNRQRRLGNSGYCTNPTWSPKGNLIAFENRIGGLLQICTVNENGSNYRQLTANDDDTRSPSWSPCGRFITFYIRNHGVFVMNFDGSNPRKIFSGDVRGVMWSKLLQH